MWRCRCLMRARPRPARPAPPWPTCWLPRAPERRFAAVAFWTTAAACRLRSRSLSDFELNPIWTMPDFVLLPVVLLSSPLIVVQPASASSRSWHSPSRCRWSCWRASPAHRHCASIVDRRGCRIGAVREAVGQRVEQEWRRNQQTRPLRIVGGDFGIANVTAFYLPGAGVRVSGDWSRKPRPG